MKKHIEQLIKHLETAMDVIQDEYGITQDEIDSKGKNCGLNRGNSIYGQLGKMQLAIEEAKKVIGRTRELAVPYVKPSRSSNLAKTIAHFNGQ